MKIPKIDSLTLLKYLLEKKMYAFTSRDIQKTFGWTPIKTYQKLKALEEQEAIIRLWRGHYIINPKISPKINPAQIIDKYLKEQYYLGLYTALTYWKLTDKPTRIYQVITTKKHLSGKKIAKKYLKATFIYLQPNHFFGYNRYPYQGALAAISDIEKTIIDAIYFLGKHITLEDTYNAILMAKNKLNYNKLIEYLKKINSPTINQRLGYLVEKIDTKQANKIKENLKISNTYIKLDPTGPNQTQEKNKKWRLIINKKIK